MRFSCAASAAHFLFYGGNNMSFSENIKSARKKKGISQQQLADELGVCRSSVAKYETGISMPHAKNINKLCRILNITYDELFDD